MWERNGPSCQLSLSHFSSFLSSPIERVCVFSRQRTAVLLSVATLSTIIIIRKVSTTATTCFLYTRTFCFSVLSDVTLWVWPFDIYSCGAGISDKKNIWKWKYVCENNFWYTVKVLFCFERRCEKNLILNNSVWKKSREMSKGRFDAK